MIRRVHPSWLVPLLLAAIALLAPSTAAASSTPQPSTPRVAAAPCTGALSANTEITNVSAVAPTRIDALANDCLGAAGPTRPLTIVSVGQGTYGSATTDGATITYDPRACATGDAGGNDFLAYTISDGVNTKPGIAVVHIARPGADPLTGAFNPLTDAPQAAFVTNSTIGSTVPLRLSWCGVAAGGAGVKAYRIEQGTNGGATFPTVVSAGTTATASTRTVTPGASFAWRVRTTDTKGRTGAFAASLPSKVTVIQDTSTSIVRYSSGWSTASGSKYSGGKEHVTSKAGATATLTVTNVRAVAVVASKATKRGSFTVYVDGVKVTPSAIGEKASTAAWRRVLYVRGLTSGAGVSHVVTFKAAGNGRVDLDAFLTLSGKLDQSLTFSAPPSAQYHGPAYPVAATASSGLPVSVSINQASWTVCTLSGGAISFLRPGSCRIDASQPGDPTWNARAASQILAVAPIPLTVSGITAADRPYDGTTTATLGTNGAALAGKVAGDVVGLDATNATGAFADRHVGTGKAVQVSGLALTGADASKYVLIQPTASAAITPRGLTVSFTAQTRPWDGTTAASIVGCTVATKLGGDDVTCDAGGASASFADSDAGTAKTVTGSGFALAGADASDYAIDAVNSAAADIAKAGQTIAFTSTPTDPSILTDTYTPTATATSGLGVDFTIDPSAAGVCHIDAGMVSMDGAGTCIVAANQDGDANHEAADEVTQTFTVDLLPQTIAFDLSGVSVAYGDAPVTIGATASSGLTVAFASQTPGVCTVAGTDVTVLTTGTCTIRASQPGNGTYAAAPDVDQSFTVARRAITVTAVADTKPADGTTASAGVPTITAGTLAAGDTGTWTQTFNTAAVGTGKTLTPAGTVAHGGTDVTDQYDITFEAVTSGVITALDQSISFSLSGVTATYGDDPVAIGTTATATSGLPVAFSSQTPGVCTVSGADVTILAAGTCTVRASQPGDDTYGPAPDVDQSFTVARRAITVTAVSDTKLADGTTASAGIPTVTSGSLATGDTGAWTQTFDTPAIGTGKTLTPAGTVAHGPTDVTASYDITFVPVTTGVITAGALPQTIAFDLSGVSVAYGDAPVTIAATASSGLTVAFASQTPGVCTVAGTDVTVLTTGTCTIRASQPGNGTYAAAPDVDQSFTVARRAITVTAVADTKPADGTTASAGVPTITAGTLAAGDTGTWTQTFNTAAVGTGKTLTPAGTVAHGGTEVTARYLITFVAVTTGVITPGAADVTTSTVAVSPGSVKADGVDTATVTVHLYDRLGNSLVTSGGTVTVFADHGSVGAVTDNANGTYTAIYTSDTVKGKVTVSAKLNGTAIVQTVQLNQH